MINFILYGLLANLFAILALISFYKYLESSSLGDLSCHRIRLKDLSKNLKSKHILYRFCFLIPFFTVYILIIFVSNYLIYYEFTKTSLYDIIKHIVNFTDIFSKYLK